LTTLSELAQSDLMSRLAGKGLALDLGAARIRVRTSLDELGRLIQRMYGAFPLMSDEGFFDVTASVERVAGLRRLWAPQVRFVTDSQQPFEPFPADTHLPLLEWGLNFCLADRLNQHLLLHAGVVERNGVGIVIPGIPGTGKSTLTAALACRGFRLLSDEFGVVRLADVWLLPMVRPAALKNRSIEVIRAWAPDAALGPAFPKTRKGTVCHLAPPGDSVARRHTPVEPGLVVFPRYRQDAKTQVVPVSRARAFSRLAINSFNYQMLGPSAFEAVERIARKCECLELHYSDLAAAHETLVSMCERQATSGEAPAIRVEAPPEASTRVHA
jgi:HprK-related kinase A